jgi:sec-independent protein translocase protein TatA
MFGISNGDLLVILLLILLLFGPKKIPEIMRALGTGVRDLKRAGREATDEFHRLTTEHDEPPPPAAAPAAAESHPDEKSV